MRELWNSRAIAVVLARRALKVRYRQTLIGAAWVLIQPLLLMLVFTVFFGLFVRVPSGGAPYAVFVYVGLLAWSIVGKVIGEGSATIVNNAQLIRRVYFPRAHLPISIVLSSLVDLVFGFIALGALLALFATLPGPGIAFVPLLLAISVAGALGVTFWLSSLYSTYRDVAQLLPFVLQVWFFLTPIIYPSSVIPEQFRTLYWLNPMAVVVEGMRWAFAGLPAPPFEAFALGLASALVLLVSGYVFFRHREPSLSDVV